MLLVRGLYGSKCCRLCRSANVGAWLRDTTLLNVYFAFRLVPAVPRSLRSPTIPGTFDLRLPCIVHCTRVRVTLPVCCLVTVSVA